MANNGDDNGVNTDNTDTGLPYHGDEKATLHASLDRVRDAVLWKLDGLDKEQARRPMTPRARVCSGW